MSAWVVVGTGALGSIWATALQRQKQQVQIYAPRLANKTADSTDPNQIELLYQRDNNQFRYAFGRLHQPAQAPSDAVWLIAVKAWQLGPLLAELGPQLPSRAHVILSHNGMGVADKELAAFPEWRLFDLVTTQAGYRQNQTHVVHAGVGDSWIGPRHNRLAVVPDWLATIQQAMPPTRWDTCMLYRRWHKLAINCAINPLATLHGIVNGELAKPAYQADIQAICREAAAVFQARLAYAGKADHLKPLSYEQIYDSVQQVISNTANNRCSMLQDKQAKRPTEINFLNGYLVRQGQQLGIATPVNLRLWQALR